MSKLVVKDLAGPASPSNKIYIASGSELDIANSTGTINLAVDAGDITSGTLSDGRFAADSILFIKEAVVAYDHSVVSDPGATFTDCTGCTITVAAADANKCSKLVVIMFSSFRVDRSTAIYTFSDSRIARSAPSSANSGNVVFGIAEANNNPEIYDSVTNVYVDESLSNADHTYTLQFRNGTGNAITAGNTYPRYGEFYVMVVGVK